MEKQEAENAENDALGAHGAAGGGNWGVSSASGVDASIFGSKDRDKYKLGGDRDDQVSSIMHVASVNHFLPMPLPLPSNTQSYSLFLSRFLTVPGMFNHVRFHQTLTLLFFLFLT
jgi:hypothetical protein